MKTWNMKDERLNFYSERYFLPQPLSSILVTACERQKETEQQFPQHRKKQNQKKKTH